MEKRTLKELDGLPKLGESAQERLVKYFAFKETDVLGKNNYKITSADNLMVFLPYLIESYKRNSIDN